MNKEQKITELLKKQNEIYDKIDALENRMIELMDSYNEITDELCEINPKKRYVTLDVKIIPNGVYGEEE